MRALTGLRQAGLAIHGADGKPPEMPLDRIVRDPDNPRPPLHLRTQEEQQKQRELNTNIKKRGVKSPISLRPHPTIPNTWIINHGHCRYDGAEAAGHASIPYFIDPNFDSYDQVAENLHRSDLSIWAMAAFIARKLAEGDTKARIAEGLGKESQNYITEHLALVDAPGCLHQAYSSGVRSTRTLYDLRRAYDAFPERVEAWCASGERITRETIREFLDGLRHDVIPAAGAVVPFITSGPVFAGALEPKLPVEVKPDGRVNELGSSVAGRDSGSHAAAVVAVYKGERGLVLAGTRVKIVLEGRVAPLLVRLDELVFEALK